jgi:hypothetical protein
VPILVDAELKALYNRQWHIPTLLHRIEGSRPRAGSWQPRRERRRQTRRDNHPTAAPARSRR